jgi:hypothetical protein
MITFEAARFECASQKTHGATGGQWTKMKFAWIAPPLSPVSDAPRVMETTAADAA